MKRGMKIYTKTGDAGKTGLFSGERVSKDHPRVSAYGSLDEMNSFLGVALAAGPSEPVRERLVMLQNLAFELGSDLATVSREGTSARIGQKHIEDLEAGIDQMCATLPELRTFILPGGTMAAAQIHVARTVCRRVEREVIHASKSEAVSPQTIIFLNRLSDYLFVLSRYENHCSGVAEPAWIPSK